MQVNTSQGAGMRYSVDLLNVHRLFHCYLQLWLMKLNPVIMGFR